MAAPPVSSAVPDWSRERVRPLTWSASARLLRSVRRHQYWTRRWGLIGYCLRLTWLVRYRFWAAVTGADIPLNGHLAGGLLLPHPNGIVIHPDAIVGPNCLLFQQVTLGTGGPIPGAPYLSGHVDVGAGAKILGGVTIGPHARIGANAVVLTDIPAGATAVGIPARVLLPAGVNEAIETK